MKSIPRRVRTALLCAWAAGAMVALGGGCLDRPISIATPNTTARVTINFPQNNVDKIDLLFMIDNSASMSDKQAVLAQAVPDLLDRLINPVCVDSDPKGNKPETHPGPNAPCPAGMEREFNAIGDIHIGVVTSSMGAHGADQCSASDKAYNNDDKGHLVVRDGASTYRELGFLAWDPAGTKNNPPGEASESNLKTSFQNLVTGAGQSGCGYEASLEAWYRFLIDPDPPASVTAVVPQPAVLSGRDDALLAQRKAFLRPDSLVAVISLSDENDCSVQEDGIGYLTLQPGTRTAEGKVQSVLLGGTSACKTDPNGACCFNCGQTSNFPAGCPTPKTDPGCAQGLTEETDPGSLRCFDQKRKYGFHFLYPVQRYIDGLTKPMIANRMGTQVANPLYEDLQCNGTNCKPPRDKSIVFFAGIAGVPWQDIAKDPKDLTKGYKTSAELGPVWPAILGDPTHSPPILPTNPLMIESIAPRGSGSDPLTMEPLAGVSAGPRANSVNGHEWDTDKIGRTDLQYACVFDLPPGAERDCKTAGNSCDCSPQYDGKVLVAADAIRNPLCQDVSTGAYGNTQYRAKGYPGTRFLQVLQGIKDQAIVASICPSNTTNSTTSDFGYRPAVAAIINKLKGALQAGCLPNPLEVNTCKNDSQYDKVPCVVLEAFHAESPSACDTACNDLGRSRPHSQFVTPDIAAAGNCVCALDELVGADASDCLSVKNDPKTGTSGWCYVSPEHQQVGTKDALGKCADQNLRFFGKNGTPRKGAEIFITCQEKTADITATADVPMSCGGGDAGNGGGP